MKQLFVDTSAYFALTDDHHFAQYGFSLLPAKRNRG